MHSFHCNAGVLRRTKCESAFGWAAYGGCTKFDFGGRRGDYRRYFGDHVANIVLLPPAAPESYFDPGIFLLAVTAAEKRRDAQEGRTLTFAIPRQVPTQLIVAVVTYVLAGFTRLGMSVYVDVENTEASDGHRNVHVHVLISLREVDNAGFGNKARPWNQYFRRDGGRYFRAVVAARLTLACAHLGLAIPLDPRTNKERGLGPPEPRLNKTLWKRHERGESVSQIDDLLLQRREKTTAAPPEPQPGVAHTCELKVWNVISRKMNVEAQEAALGVIERYLEEQNVPFERGVGAVRIMTGSQDTILFSPTLMVAFGHVTPDCAELLAGCARALDWPAVVVDGDLQGVDDLIIAAARQEIAVVNYAAGDRALASIRSLERLRQAVVEYDRVGVASRSVRSFQAYQFQKAMAYGPQLVAKADERQRTERRQAAAQSSRAMAYRPKSLKTSRTEQPGSLAANEEGEVARCDLLPAFGGEPRRSAAQFMRSMPYGCQIAMTARSTQQPGYQVATAPPKIESSPALQAGRSFGSATGSGAAQVPVQKSTVAAATPSEGLELMAMPEMVPRQNRTSELELREIERIHAEKAQTYDAMAQSLKYARLRNADARKPRKAPGSQGP